MEYLQSTSQETHEKLRRQHDIKKSETKNRGGGGNL
jgi:hypothetical protein